MSTMLRHLLLTAAISLSLFMGSCGSGSSSDGNGAAAGGVSTASGAVGITMKNIKFNPDSITVDAGTTVTWTNEDPVQHNVISKGGLFSSDDFGKGGSFSYTFDRPGTYEYQCTLHLPDMEGTVVVK